MKPWLKILSLTLITIIIIFLIGGVIFYKIITSSLPDYSDKLKCKGLKNSVEIYFDDYAIPYIKASNEEDGAYALGYLHASERMFQMDFMRRAGEGRLSEILGEQAVPFDKMFLTIGFKRLAKDFIAKVSLTTKKMLASYSRGVNEYLSKNKNNLPPEFDLLNYEPYKWTSEHSLIIIRMMAWDLNISWWTDFGYTMLVQKIGEEKAKKILPDFPESGPFIIPANLDKQSKINLSFIETNREFRNFVGFNGTHIGSNNWVVNNIKSLTGKPIIANDPHLGLQAPGKWYAAIIRAGNWNVEGVTLPGVPAVVIGKNKNISWALTNVMADDADFYFEKLDSSGKKYFFNNNWNDLKIIYDTLRIKNSIPLVHKIRMTHRGPIISGIHPYKSFYPNSYDVNLNISMCWNGSYFSDEYLAFYKVNTATNWNDFKTAVSFFAVPGQNFVYADNNNNIGYICGARIPIRNSNSPTFIFDGTNNSNDWKGFVQFTEMPVLFNPLQNFIATANNKVQKNFSYHISNIWEPSSRIERINELLKSKEKHSIKDFQNYQTDFISPFAKQIVPYIVDAFIDKQITDENLKEAITQLKQWEGNMDAFLVVPSIYAVFLEKFLHNTLEDNLGIDLYNEFCFVPNVFYRTIQKIIVENTSDLFDDISTKKIETRDDIIRKSLSDALTELESTLGKNIKEWQWGKLHSLTFHHFFSGQNSMLDKIINIGEYGIGGDGTTLFNTEYSFARYEVPNTSIKSKPFENNLGPSMRYIFDFSEPDKFYLALTTGQSGHPLSKHYKDMTQLWLSGKYIAIDTDEKGFLSNSKNKLTLLP